MHSVTFKLAKSEHVAYEICDINITYVTIEEWKTTRSKLCMMTFDDNNVRHYYIIMFLLLSLVLSTRESCDKSVLTCPIPLFSAAKSNKFIVIINLIYNLLNKSSDNNYIGKRVDETGILNSELFSLQYKPVAIERVSEGSRT